MGLQREALSSALCHARSWRPYGRWDWLIRSGARRDDASWNASRCTDTAGRATASASGPDTRSDTAGRTGAYARSWSWTRWTRSTAATFRHGLPALRRCPLPIPRRPATTARHAARSTAQHGAAHADGTWHAGRPHAVRGCAPAVYGSDAILSFDASAWRTTDHVQSADGQCASLWATAIYAHATTRFSGRTSTSTAAPASKGPAPASTGWAASAHGLLPGATGRRNAVRLRSAIWQRSAGSCWSSRAGCSCSKARWAGRLGARV